MLFGFSELRKLGALHLWCLGAILGLGGAVWFLWLQKQVHIAARRRDRRLREEIEAYARMDARLPEGDAGKLGERVCRVVAEQSPFRRVAMMLRDAEERLYVASSLGMDDEEVSALHGWGERVVEEERSGSARSRRGDGGVGVQIGLKSFAIVLGSGGPAEPSKPGHGRAIVVPLWTAGGRMVGALAVCADRLLSVRRRAVEEALPPLEALAVKLGRTIENAALAERLLRAQKLAGLGMLAGGVARALNNPLTAVLGFAELIAETSSELRVKKDAQMIVGEALRMRGTVQSLLNFCRPAIQSDEPVEVTTLLKELAADCVGKLESRGVRLVVQAAEHVPAIRGNRDRLRQVMEHLLNNAAQAVGTAQAIGVDSPLADGGGGQHAIRVTVSHDERALHVIVSDTGPGFREPGRAFDPFYTTRQPGEGAGLGLSICYGIVREHGGEISAFNLHPHGAAVVVELPVSTVVTEKRKVSEVA